MGAHHAGNALRRAVLHCNFEEGVKELVLAREVNFSEIADRREEVKSVSNLTKLAGKKNCRQKCFRSKTQVENEEFIPPHTSVNQLQL